LQGQFEAAGQSADVARHNAERLVREYSQDAGALKADRIERLLQLLV
jgi:hypothetical protein